MHKIEIKSKQIEVPKTQPKIERFVKFTPIKKNFESDITKLVACSLMPPHKIANSDVLRRWCHAAWKKDIPNSPATIWRMVDDTAASDHKKIATFFTDIKVSSFCCDEWTSRNGKRFMNVNYHGNDVLISLGLVRISVSATAENLGGIFMNHLASFGINRPTAITTDGASVMKSMAMKLNVIHQLCILHGINLAVTDVLYKNVDLNTNTCQVLLEKFEADEDISDMEQEPEVQK